jgi:hypothetical protein
MPLAAWREVQFRWDRELIPPPDDANTACQFAGELPPFIILSAMDGGQSDRSTQTIERDSMFLIAIPRQSMRAFSSWELDCS